MGEYLLCISAGAILICSHISKHTVIGFVFRLDELIETKTKSKSPSKGNIQRWDPLHHCLTA